MKWLSDLSDKAYDSPSSFSDSNAVTLNAIDAQLMEIMLIAGKKRYKKARSELKRIG
jgi:hypothetical protein